MECYYYYVGNENTLKQLAQKAGLNIDGLSSNEVAAAVFSNPNLSSEKKQEIFLQSQTVVARTIEQIRSILFTRLEGKSFYDAYVDPQFKYYHAETVEEIQNGFLEAKKAYKRIEDAGLKDSKERVTGLAGTMYGEIGGDIDTSTQQGRARKLDSDFRTDFGTVVHSAFEIDESEWSTKLVPEIERVFKQYNQVIENEPGLLGVAYGSTQDVLSFIVSCSNALKDPNKRSRCIDQLTHQLRDLKQRLYDEYGTNDFHEWEIASRSDSRVDSITGHIDLAFITPDKKVVIVDFKTTPKSDMSVQTKGSHWIQLELYKKILADYGIKYEDISYKNIILQYRSNEDGGVWSISEENPAVDVDKRARDIMSSITRKYFPVVIQGGPNAKERVQKVKDQHTALCSQLKSRKLTEEGIRYDTLKRCKNENEGWCYQAGSEYRNGAVVKYSFGETEKTVKIFSKKDGSLISEQSIDDFVQKELDAIEKNKVNQFDSLKILIQTRDINGIRKHLEYSNPKAAAALWTNLYPYLGPDYEYYCVPELEELQIICMRHVDGTYDFIQIAPTGNLSYSPNPRESILSSLITDKNLLEKYQEAGQILRPTVGNHYLLQAALGITQFADRMPDFKLGEIKVVSSTTGEAWESVTNSDRIELTFRLLSTYAKENPEIKNIELFADTYEQFYKLQKEPYSSLAEKQIVAACRAAYVEYGNEALSAFEGDNWRSADSLNAKIHQLQTVKEKLRADADANSKLTSNTDASKGINNAIDYCDKLIDRLISILQEKQMPIEMNEMSSYGISFKESIIAGYNLLAKGTVDEFTKQGMQLSGLAQSLESSVSYANPDQLIRRFVHFYDAATAQIRTQMQEEAVELNDAAENFIAWGKTVSKYHIGATDPIFGNHDALYADLLQKGKNGKPDNAMRFINPYTSRELVDQQTHFLEVLLWTINRHRMPNTIIDAKHKHMSYAEFSKTQQFQTYKTKLAEDSQWLNVPLHAKDGSNGTWEGFTSVLRGKKTLKQFVGAEINRMRTWIEPDALTQKQKNERDKAVKDLKWYNYYKDNDQNRAERTEHNDYTHWDINFNRLAIDYALSDVRSYYYGNSQNGLLATADRMLAEIKLLEVTTGKDFSKQTEALMNRIQVSVYGKSLVTKEWEDVMAGMGIVKQMLSIAKISVRPMLFIKEMMLGRIRNTAAILGGMIQNGENKITMTHLMEAAGVVFGPEFFGKNSQKLFGQLSIGSKSLADVLNDVYGINDRDLSVIGEKVAYDSYGLHNWGARMLYLNTIAPDWFNRMILFIAKMKADGTWDAHKLENGHLVYDMNKDARINEFWKNRERPKNTPEYKKAESLYKLRMQQFESEGWTNADGTPLRYGQLDPDTGKPVYDPFPRAYTSQEEDSIKEQIGLIYGYYSSQERSNMQKGLWWTMYTQFLTFMPAEVRKYLAVGTPSSIVNTVHEKDPITGELLYWEEQDDPLHPDGAKLHVKTTRQYNDKHQANAPVLKDVYNAYEGLLISTVKLAGQLCRGDFKAIKENPQRIKNAELFLFNTLFAALIAAIVAYLSGLGAKSTGIDIAADLLKKTGNELDFYHTVLQPVGNFGIVGTDFLQGTFTNAFKTIQSDKYSLYDLSKDTFAIVKDAHLNLDFD